MTIREALRTGLEGMRSHKLRSFLTALGIIFGVAAVISMLSIGEGARQEALEQIQLMGIGNIILHDVPVKDAAAGEGRVNRSSGLSSADVRAIARVHPLVSNVVPERQFKAKVRYGREELDATLVGTTPAYAAALKYHPSAGRFFDYDEVHDVARVCALGEGIKRELFYYKDPIGQRVKVGNQWFTVVGVMEHRATGSDADKNEVRDTNRDVYVPITTALQRFPRDAFASELSRIIVQVGDPDRIREAAAILDRTMTRRHGGVEDYRIVVPEALLAQRQATQRIFNIVMGAIAGISLLVGGIGIMNIMLASVLERTREIGIRRAVGACRRDILGQFLLEATVVSFLGGILGIGLGFGLTRAIATYAGWRTIVSFTAVLLAFGVSAAVGILFGFYPARRAAQLSPIDCLRYE